MDDVKDPVAEYYDRCRERTAAAQKRLREARDRGASWSEIRELEEELDRVSNTGD